MNTIDSKAILKVNSDGDVLKCAKGLNAAKCGWKPGDKVCGACGAMAVMTKGAPMPEDDDEEYPVPAKNEKRRALAAAGKRVAADADYGVGMEREMDEEVADDDQAESRRPTAPNMEPADTEDAMEGPMEAQSEDTEDEMERQVQRKRYREMRLAAMGMGAKDAKEGSFLCGTSRKVMPAGSTPCDGCAGGCFPVKGMPDLLAIEGMAESMYGGKVLASGYSGQHDTFVVSMQRKDGRIIEAFFDGAGEPEGWHRLPEHTVSPDDIVGDGEAIVSALGAVQGKALFVGVGLAQGQPAYRVEIDGDDGYSYDVFVGMDGKVLGMDQYEYATKSADPAILASLMEFEAMSTEEELRDQGLI